MKIKLHENGNYYAHIIGAPPVNLKTSNKREAARLAKAAKLDEIEFASKAELLTAEVVSRLSAKAKVTCETALVEWERWAVTVGLSPKYVHDAKGYLNLMFREFGLEKKSPGIITEGQVDAFVNPPGGQSFSTSGVRHAVAKSFFRLCIARGFVVRNPAELVRIKRHKMTHAQKEPKVREAFTEAEVKKLLNQLDDPFWKACVWLGSEVGLRLGDVAKLEWETFQKKNKIVVWTDKRDRRIEMPISAELYQFLKSMPKEHDRFVFPEQAAIHEDMNRRSRLSVYFTRVLAKHDIEGKSAHSLRHTFATRHAAAGTPVDEIREKMGHVSEETTRGYIHT